MIDLSIFTIEQLFQGLSGRAYFYFLDSIGGGRYSYMGFDPVSIETDFPNLPDFGRHDFFTGGAVGFVSYEGERLFGVFNKTIVIDHQLHTIQFYHYADEFNEVPITNIQNYFLDYQSDFRIADVSSSWSFTEYQAAFFAIKQAIHDGDIYQANLSQRFDVPVEGNIAAYYWHLRTVSPAPMCAFLKFNEVCCCSVSPERFFSIYGRQIITEPIKGTRPRGQTVVDDQSNRQALVESDKDSAELVMITDLLRNDLGRICECGSIVVQAHREIQAFAHVFHSMSRISGQLRLDVDIPMIFDALFPGGSITGAPKIRSMAILSEVESVPRGLYTGAIGYIGFGLHVVDFNIAIRTLYGTNRHLFFHGGGGLVSDSDVYSEYQESLDKLAGIMSSLNPNM